MKTEGSREGFVTGKENSKKAGAVGRNKALNMFSSM